MIVLPLITQIAAVLSVAALLWLAVRAFRKNLAWGVAVLLLSPFGATFFGIRYWDKEKNAFLAYLASFMTATALALYLFTTWGGWELVKATSTVNRGIQSRLLTARDAEHFIKTNLSFTEKSGLNLQDERKLEQVRNKLASIAAAHTAADAAEAAEAERVESSSAYSKTEEKPVRYRLVYVPIEVADAKHYVGSTVKVKRKNVTEKEYRLIGSTGRKLEFTQRAGRGSYSFHYHTSDIEKIRVLTKQQY